LHSLSIKDTRKKQKKEQTNMSSLSSVLWAAAASGQSAVVRRQSKGCGVSHGKLRPALVSNGRRQHTGMSRGLRIAASAAEDGDADRLVVAGAKATVALLFVAVCFFVF
jgi:hypothetical protein